MTQVLIVAKTHMRNGACVGGFEIATKKNVRLLTSNGENQPKDTPYQVGQIWDLDYVSRPQIIPPHIEDILVNKRDYVNTIENVHSFLINNAPIWRGSPSKIFNSKVNFPQGKSGFITNKIGLPLQSVGFWMPDKDLELTILNDQKHYFYFGEHNDIYAFPYVGYPNCIDKIRRDTLVRVSLARWWNPNPKVAEKMCYCQLSGWYSN